MITQLDAADRKQVGTVDGTTLDGKHVSLADFRGKVVVVNVWGSWCPPCRAEGPLLSATAKQLAPRGVQFLGILVRDNPDSAKAYERRFGIGFPSIDDPSGRSLLAFHRRLNPSTIPTTLVVDRQGRLRASIVGQVTSKQTLIDLIQDAGK